MMNTLPVRRPTVAAIALLGLSAAAHADVASKVDIGITDLRYRLVDLKPDDGQAPSLTVYDETVYFSASVRGGAHQLDYTRIDPLPTASLKSDVGGGTYAEVGPHILASHVQAEGPYHLPSGFEIKPAVYEYVDSRGASVGIWDSEDREGPKGLLLSPHSQLIFEGTATLSSYASASALLDADGKPVTTPYKLDVSSYGSIYTKLETRADLNNTVTWTAQTAAGALYTLNKDGVVTVSAPSSDSKTLPFLLTLSNDSDEPLDARFDWGISGYSGTTAVTPTAVPEPDAWALVLAGMLVVPAALKRARQQRA